jgi:poly(3-hydroxybutyrate) depolymerase
MATLAGCGSEPTVTTDGDLTTTRWSGGDDTTTVELVAITGSPHAWPGSPATGLKVSGTPYPNYDASREIWAFLSTHPRAGS